MKLNQNICTISLTIVSELEVRENYNYAIFTIFPLEYKKHRKSRVIYKGSWSWGLGYIGEGSEKSQVEWRNESN